ncbi:Diacylglycerol kinase [Aedoeadaptatus ivorii]|uniref:Diacylglycerol kinase n=1 Tax=Aedoeadaptatus ivorii TaxID=54006 RepID=A0A448V326_9FIRM|nr:diacylglycerol kinase family protein [Peptoniphilus ivorii]VEJ36204.1 Diacylglycerol kinase [Peptoniphilus ivorii]
MKRIKIIANPSSGREGAVDILKKLIAPFSRMGASLLLEFTRHHGDAEAFAARDDGEDCIIAMGGDGTVNQVVNGLYAEKRNVPLAVYPAGTVNDFAEYLKIPKDPIEFVSMVERGHVVPVDLGLCGDRAFINVCAAGLFTELGYSVSDASKSSMGRLAYYLEGIRSFRVKDLSREYFRVRLETADGTVEKKVMLVMVSNSSSIGGFSRISPAASIKDGLLEVIAIEEMPFPKMIELITAIGVGKHTEHEHFLYFKTDKVTISADRALRIDIDGEPGPHLPQTVEVVAGGVPMIIN